MTARSAASIGGDAISFGETGLSKAQTDASGDLATMLTKDINAFARISSMPRGRSTQLMVTFRVAAQNYVALQQRIGYKGNIQSVADVRRER